LGPNLMNATDPIFNNVLVTTFDGMDYSIYTIRLVHSDFMKTPQYTSFQMIAFGLMLFAGGCAAGFTAVFLLVRRKKRSRVNPKQITPKTFLSRSPDGARVARLHAVKNRPYTEARDPGG